MQRTMAVDVGAALACLLALAGCAKNTEGAAPSGGPVSVSAQPNLAGLLPAPIKAKGSLAAGMDATYAPMEFKDSAGKLVGFDVDLMNATAQRLGLTVNYVDASFDNVIPGVTGAKYDVGVSSFSDNATREKAVDFVDYLTAGTQWGAPAGTTVDPEDACGLSVAVQTGSIQETSDLPARNSACTAAGKPGIDILKYDKQDDATSAVVLGKAKAFVADSTITAYAVKQSAGKLQVAGPLYGAAPLGWPLKKGSALAEPLRAALQSLIDDGTYQKISDNWGIKAGTVTQAKVNGAGS